MHACLPRWLLMVATLLMLFSPVRAQDDSEQAPSSFPDLRVPANADLETLQALVEKAKRGQPRSPADYQTMQTAIRDASRQILKLLEGKEESKAYQQAELDAISASVALMTYFGEEAQQKTVEQVHAFLRSRKPLSLQDVQTGMLAAAMLELQPNKTPARTTYELLDELLEDDEREEMQSLRVNLQAAVRRLDLLGNRLELQAKTIDGRSLSIDDYEGKFVVVEFFATWCEPCLAEIPRLKEHYAKYRERGLEVVGISLDGDPEELERFLERAELPWPVIHDNHSDPNKTLQMQFGVLHLPTVLLVNKKGIVVSLEARGAELDRLLEMLFESPTPAADPETEPDATTSDVNSPADDSLDKTISTGTRPSATSSP